MKPIGEHLWLDGLLIGARSLRREPVLAAKRLLLPMSYWRYREFSYVMRHLDSPLGARVLDLGSPKDLAAVLARSRGYEVVATDILPQAIRLSERYARAQGLAGSGPGKVRSEVQDGRALDYPDDSFDAAYSVSVLEHIPGWGDTKAMAELVRVVRPGGRIVVTVPYAEAYRETFVDRAVYERAQVAQEPVFFERHYDMTALQTRLLSVPGAALDDLEFWGEGGLRVERIMSRLGRGRTLLSPLEPALSKLFLHQVRDGDRRHRMAVFFTVERAGDPSPMGPSAQ